MNIHPTASVSENSRIMEGVTIGPRALVAGETLIEEGCTLGPDTVLEAGTHLGKNVTVGPGAVLGSPPQDMSFNEQARSSVRVGDGTTIHALVTIHRGTQNQSATLIGRDCILETGSHVGHNAVIGDRVRIGENCLIGGHVQIDSDCELACGSVFHQHLQIGRFSSVGRFSRIVKDVPPFSRVHGHNALQGVNLQRLKSAGFPDSHSEEIFLAFQLMFSSGHNITQALEAAILHPWCPEAMEIFEFARKSRRGLCRMSSQTSTGTLRAC